MMALNPFFFQGPSDVRATRPLPHWGTFWGGPTLAQKTGINSPPQAAEVWTVAVPATVQNGATYWLAEGGVQANYLTTSTDQDDLGNGLVTSIGSVQGATSNGGTLRSRWTPTYTGGVITLTATWPGVVSGTWTASTGFTDDLGTPALVTAAADAADVEPARALVAQSNAAGTPGNREVFVPIIGDLTAQVMTITITSVAGATFTPTITFAGKTLTGDAVVHDTSDTVTALAILTEYNAILDAAFPAGASVVATQSAGAVILTAEVAGATFDANIIAAGAAATATKVLTTGPDITTSLERAFVGISERSTRVQAQTRDGSEAAYKGNQGVTYVTSGTGTVERQSGETWSLHDDLYIILTADRATSGKFGNAAGANRIWMPSGVLTVDQGGTAEDTTTGVIRLHVGA